MLGEGRPATPATAPAPAPAAETKVAAHTRVKPTGRKPLPEKLPRVDVEVLPPEVQRQGLDAFERIDEDVTETVEQRQASFVVVRVRKPKLVAKERARNAETQVLQAEPPELPIDRALAGPGLMADTIVRRWQDHLPLHRLERIYGREGLEVARSTVCGWHEAVAELAKPLVEAMWTDALTAPYLCTDATGVLVQAREKCRRGHFWVVIAPERHVLFEYTAKHDLGCCRRAARRIRGLSRRRCARRLRPSLQARHARRGRLLGSPAPILVQGPHDRSRARSPGHGVHRRSLS